METNTNVPFLNFIFTNGRKNASKTFLKQPFGDTWEEYTWGEVGQKARKLATGLQSRGLRENAPTLV